MEAFQIGRLGFHALRYGIKARAVQLPQNQIGVVGIVFHNQDVEGLGQCYSSILGG